jgi:hypothetical protein
MIKPFLAASFLAILFSLSLISARADDWNASGDYGLFEIAVDPKTNRVTGYYVSQTGLSPDGHGSMFSCIFYLTGKKEGNRASIQTYYPADKKREIISGEIIFIPEQEALRIKLKESPPGSMACPDVVQGDLQVRNSKPESEWLEIRVVKAPRAHFFETPEATAPRKTYVVEGDGVEVLEKRLGWVLATFRGKNKGWLKEKDLYPK